MRPQSTNVALTYAYLAAVGSLGDADQVADFYAPDVVVQEFPSRIAPHGHLRRPAELREAYERGRKLLQSQTYKVQRIFEQADEVIAELEWTGVLAIPVLNLPAGSEIKAFCAMFLTFRDGKIVSQRNYDCYPPFEPPASAA